MYKNFSLTDKERKQILEMHQSKGHKKPINENNISWEKISELSKNYYDAIRNLDAVGCDDSEKYAEYYHIDGPMEPGDRDDYDDNDYHDNGYSHSQQSFADRLDYANSAEDPITKAERRMGA